MFRVKWRRRWLISKSSFSRQCVGRICDVDMKVTLNQRRPDLIYAQTLYLHQLCQNKPKSEFCKTAMSPFDFHVSSSSVVFMIHAATHSQFIIQISLLFFPYHSLYMFNPYITYSCLLYTSPSPRD